MLLNRIRPDAFRHVVEIGRDVYRIQGIALGDLGLALATGTLDRLSPEAPESLKELRGAKTILLGGSIGMVGYSGVVLPHIARLRMQTLAGTNAVPALIAVDMKSADAGALGAWQAQPRAARIPWIEEARRLHDRGRIPLLATVDVGGTKTHIAVAIMDAEGELTEEVIARETFPTPSLPPDGFYAAVARRLCDRLAVAPPYAVLDVVALGQPGRFRHGRDVIGEGTALDLGDFAGVCPSKLLAEWIAAYGGRQVDVLVCNDGRAQLAGLLHRYLRTDDAAKRIWSLKSDPILYLGPGTGLGSAACKARVNDDNVLQSELVFLEQPPLGFLPIDPQWFATIAGDAQLFDVAELGRATARWGDLLSGKFLHRALALAELQAIDNGRRLFTSEGGGRTLSREIVREATADRRMSLIDPEQLNEALVPFTADHQARADIDLQRPWLEDKLREALQIMKREIGGTLARELLAHHEAFYAVTREVLSVHQRGKTVHFVGVGKSNEIACTLSRFFENLHIRSGHVRLTAANSENLIGIERDDLVFFVSNSGRAPELLNILPSIQAKGCRTVAISGSADSELAARTHWFLSSRVDTNPAPVQEAPTTSTTAALAIGAAVAIVASWRLPHTAEDMALDRPGERFDFSGAVADLSFDEVAMAHDIVEKLADAIGSVLDTKDFLSQAFDLVRRILATRHRGGTIHFTGAGSSFDVAEKIAATLTSIGINAFALLPVNLPVGDLGHVNDGDLMIIVSYSGETRSLEPIVENLRTKHVDCVLITASPDSTLARQLPGRLVIIGENLDDGHMVPVPGQKILASFINLAVGDALAVVLAHSIRTTEEQFATRTHPGGAVGRGRAQENEAQLRTISEYQIAAEPPEWQRKSLSFIRRRDSGVGRESIIVGTGATGLALIGYELARHDYALFLVDRNPDRIAELQQLREYRVRLCPDPPDVYKVGKVCGILADDLDRLSELALRIDHMFVSVGRDHVVELDAMIAAVVRTRFRYRIREPFNIVFVENFAIDDDVLNRLKQRVGRCLSDPDLEVYLNHHIAFVPAVDEALLPGVTTLREPLRRERVTPPLYLDAASWRQNGEFPWRNSITLTANFRAIHRRKLWGHNMAHALVAYTGAARGHEFIHDAVDDPLVAPLVDDALRAVGQALYARERLWDEQPLDDYVRTLLTRYRNPALGDTIARVGREPLRKLEVNDRLVGPINYIGRYGRHDPHPILVGAVAALHYAAGTTQSSYNELRNTLLARISIDDPLKKVKRAEEEFQRLLPTTTKRMVRRRA